MIEAEVMRSHKTTLTASKGVASDSSWPMLGVSHSASPFPLLGISAWIWVCWWGPSNGILAGQSLLKLMPPEPCRHRMSELNHDDPLPSSLRQREVFPNKDEEAVVNMYNTTEVGAAMTPPFLL